ncbi:protocatechuate 3,4-dioxygenase subunit alpha [Oricola cellulosilytica]|uniref:Protocatechuate 3,4-dioxygenase subunit alpha n=1 Tax=Oricola cellulosilytica TaxID=1429082 RepID=A0A4R0P7P6_9HYPH|nr:protocatechuate 3,4-dioxygenase subunit alpha [Oricola cellulosilytica]TCD11934.1 protocatechuate 3,4-dioxygenase subunit alpha [Oricola cellulosilytica]
MVPFPGNLKESPSQTAGPYVHIGCTPNAVGIGGPYGEDAGARLVNDKTKGDRISITGRVIDGANAPLRDAMIEIWQADADGLFNSPLEKRGAADTNFRGWGRQAADGESGQFRFETVMPGQVPFAADRMQAPHAQFWIVARGINLGLHTRMYFPDEADANAADPVLQRIEPRWRVATLIASGARPNYTFDIRLQGENETVFFDV